MRKKESNPTENEMKKEIYIDDEVDRRLHQKLAVEATVNLTCDPKFASRDLFID